jgi:hypothetical protein
MRRLHPPSPWTVLAITIVAVGLLGVLLVGYVNRSQQRICGIIVLLDDRNQGLPPPQDEDSARFRRELHNYRTGLGC